MASETNDNLALLQGKENKNRRQKHVLYDAYKPLRW